MNIFQLSNLTKGNSFRSVAGLLLILAGAVLYIDRQLNTGWLSYLILPTTGLIFYVWGIREKNSYLVLTGGVIGGVGAGIGIALSPMIYHQSLAIQIGQFILFTGLGWLVIVGTTLLLQKPFWWGLIPSGVLVGLGYFLVFSQTHWVNLILWVGLGTGMALLAWGLAVRLIGLVIPGCLLITSCPGIFFAWTSPDIGNSLVLTGIMLVWFAFGWALITLSGRFLVHRFIWWPLIPGGILAMVGWGLYIGGDPDNALTFISNTGSLGLLIFGLYLLLMRKGIHH